MTTMMMTMIMMTMMMTITMTMMMMIRIVLPSMVRNAPSTALSLDTNSPSAKAALSYLAENVNLDSCGQQTKVYMNSIQAGNSREVASQAAAAVYQQNYAAGVPLSPACLAAEVAWKNAVAVGQDPVLPAALAYMEASPSDSPCYVSGKEYIQVQSLMKLDLYLYKYLPGTLQVV